MVGTHTVGKTLQNLLRISNTLRVRLTQKTTYEHVNHKILISLFFAHAKSIFLKCKISLTSVQTRTFQTLLNITSMRFTGIFLHSNELTLLSIPQTHTTHQTCYTSVLCIKPSVIQSVVLWSIGILCYVRTWIYRLSTTDHLVPTYRIARDNQQLQTISVTITTHIREISIFFLPPACFDRPVPHTYIYIYIYIYIIHCGSTRRSAVSEHWYQQMIPQG